MDKEKPKNRILVAPLDWGLGHATRCVPVIRELIRQGEEVVIAADGYGADLLKDEFPDLQFIGLPGYNIKYPAFLPMSLSMLLQMPKILVKIIGEHYRLKSIIRKFGIKAVISDHRYGLWNKHVSTVLIIHQVMVKCPQALKIFEPVIYRIHRLIMNRFDSCWIPDDDGKLSGDLTLKFALPANAEFIGTLSRWKGLRNLNKEKKYDVVGIISGPEPNRTSFENLLSKQFEFSKLRALMILGKPGIRVEKQINERFHVISHLDSSKLFDVMTESEMVICRAGYSGIMDMIAAGKNAVLIPTPGQTEQEYLAVHLEKKKLFFTVDESEFNLEDSIRKSGKYSVKNYEVKNDKLPHLITAWRKKISAL